MSVFVVTTVLFYVYSSFHNARPNDTNDFHNAG